MSGDTMKWLDYAEGELGVKEIPFPHMHNPRILEYLSTTTLGNKAKSRDETPSCSAFVNWCFTKAKIQGTDSALARSWMTWGTPFHMMSIGDVMVVKNKAVKVGGYHVAFPYRQTKTHVLLLGSNQSDTVCFKRFSLNNYEIVAIRSWIEYE
jgi:uncharacterized protein (TIGR02594 family)